jgi:hypothetical protein
VDSGVPPASNRAGARAGGGGVKPPAAKGIANKGEAAKSNGNGSSRPGPVDPRTEDPNSPRRNGKTVWRRPGILTPRTTKHREVGAVEAPIEFSLSLPLAPVESIEVAEAKITDTVVDAVIDAEPIALAPTVEVLAPPPQAPTQALPMSLVPPALVPVDLRTMPVLETAPPILYDEAATIDDVTMIGPILDHRPLHRPIHFRRSPKPRVRRVTRVVRHVDTWSVFKVALVFNVFFYAVAMVAGVLLWQVAYATGTIDNVEKFFEGFGWESFDFNGGQIFHNAWIAGLFVAVGLTGLAVLLATLFNLITDLVGGIRLSVLEEEVRTRAARGTELVYDVVPASPESAPEPTHVMAQREYEVVEEPTVVQPVAGPVDEPIAG